MNAAAGPRALTSADRLADGIIEKVGKNIVLAMPLGLGKANHIANALFDRARGRSRACSLHIFTALTLEVPRGRHEIERRFVAPMAERLFKGYPDLSYAAAIRSGPLPANIKVNEFFFLAGQWLGVPAAQQNYISANYTHALRIVLDLGVNVIAQLVAPRRDERGPLQPELQSRPHARPLGRAPGRARQFRLRRAGQHANCRSWPARRRSRR